MWLFLISLDQVCIKRNPFQVHRCSEGDAGNEEAIRKVASNSEKIAWRCVGVREGTTLKVITFPLGD
jgi:hypothetical protein